MQPPARRNHSPCWSANLINLRIKGQQEPTTVTSNHRYWSAGRNEIVEAGHLKPGEQENGEKSPRD
jgi:hypothetical protein